jgi:peptidoglycan/xylan/chitin deacetylase (PgdA/CDA1 family)
VPPARLVLYAATVGVLAFVVGAVLTGPPSLATAICVSAAYSALFTAGVLRIQLRMFADAVVRGPKGARGVALTFDDGPHPIHTRKVLDLLDAKNAKATFFVIAKKAERYPEVVREVLARGHAVGLHSYEHDRLFSFRPPSRVKADLTRGIAVLEKITGARPEIFRPPVGHTTPAIARVCDELDLAIVGWSVRARDGLGRVRAGAVAARVKAGLEDGAIVALHDARERGDDEPASVRALADILEAVAEARLDVVPLAPWVTLVEGS